MRGSSFLSSGPWSRPVSASRSGWNRARPFLPGGGGDGPGPGGPGLLAEGLGRQEVGGGLGQIGILDHRGDGAGDQRPEIRRIGEAGEIGLHRLPELRRRRHAERRQPPGDRLVRQAVEQLGIEARELGRIEMGGRAADLGEVELGGQVFEARAARSASEVPVLAR